MICFLQRPLSVFFPETFLISAHCQMDFAAVKTHSLMTGLYFK